ncbi:DUF3078 domain-containing protein [Mesohalobacter halotolerans]|uniref:DUF3078 domain-containing protein n=1 Tax=Mesohalobacter halotolerans TaxID=1883405 RepID=A0A4U5TRC9_9FLAO|nr:DUF3078 domain-containing protein [Mesohalobacter halotolerans]
MRLSVCLILIFILNVSLVHSQIPESKIPRVIITSFEAQKMHHMLPLELDEKELVRIIDNPVFWTKVNMFSLQASEVSFTNWNSGGTNSVSGLLGIEIERNYKDKRFKWDNQLIIRVGANKQSDQDIRKTEDHLEINSKAGFSFKKNSNWYYLGRLNFNTQFFNGFNFPNTSDIISQFMAPGYLFMGLGVEHKIKKQNFYMYLSPMTFKSTFVLNQKLANDGAFGVDEAIRDTDGNIIEEGKQVRVESGILINNEYKKELFDNVLMNHRISIYTDYINNFGNIDIDWEVNFSFKVNSFIKANFGSHLRYDDDVKIRIEQEDGSFVEGGSRVQWKQQLGIGVTFEL